MRNTTIFNRLLSLSLLTICICATISCKHNNETGDMTPEEILNILDIKIEKDSKNADLYYDRANIYMQMGRANDAIIDLNHAISLKNDKKEYYLLLGDAHFANGNVEKSYEALQNALRLDPDNNETYLKLGEIAFYSRDYDRAFDHLTHVTEKDNNNRTALFMKGFIYKEKGDTVSAITLLNKVCDLYPDYEPAFEELGMLYSAHHSPLAVDYFNTAIRLEPQNTNARYGLAMYYQEQGKMVEAEEIYKNILEINENDASAWHNRGYIQLFFYGDYELAVDYFSHAIACDTTFVEAYANRGCAYDLMNDKKHADQDFATANRLNPNYSKLKTTNK